MSSKNVKTTSTQQKNTDLAKSLKKDESMPHKRTNNFKTVSEPLRRDICE